MKAKANFLIGVQFLLPLGLSGISVLLFLGQRSIIVHGSAKLKWLSGTFRIDFPQFFIFRRRANPSSLQGLYAIAR